MRTVVLLGCLLAGASTASAQTITMSFPQSTTYVNSVPVQWSISPTTIVPSEIRMTWTYTAGYYANQQPGPFVFTLASTATSGRFTFSPLNDVSTIPNTFFSAVSPANTTALPDGTYTVRLSYVRASDGAIFTSATASMSVSTVTLPPTLTSPTSGTAYTKPIPIAYTLPSTPRLSGYPVQLVFDGPSQVVLNMASTTTVAFDLDPTNLVANTTYVRGSQSLVVDGGVGETTLVDGHYKVTLTYVDSLGHPAASAIATDVVLRTVTPEPSLLAPQDGASEGAITVNYALPVAPKAGSAKLILQPGDHVFSLPDAPLTNTFTVPGSDTSVPDGTYSLWLAYQDALGNPVAIASVSNVSYVLHTKTPTLTAPTPNAYNVVPVAFTLPQTPLANSVVLHVTGAATGTIHLGEATTQSFVIDPHDVLATAAIKSSTLTTLPDGPLNFTLSYQDTWGHPAAATPPAPIVLKTVTSPPTIVQPKANTSYGAVPIAYTLPEAPLPGSVKVTLVGPVTATFTMVDTAPPSTVFIDPVHLPDGIYPFVTRSGASALVNGFYAVIVSYQHVLGNPIAQRVVNDVYIAPPALSFGNATVNETAGTVVIPVTLTGDHVNTATVDFTTVDGTAKAGVNYATTSGTLTWPPGSSGVAQNIVIPIVDDRTRAGTLTASVALSNPVNVAVPVATATLNILDHDTASVAVTQPDGVTQVEEGGGSASFTLVLSSRPSADVVVTLATGSLLAVAPSVVKFTSEGDDWSTPQTVAVTGPPIGSLNHDATELVAFEVTSDDPFYGGQAVRSVSVQVKHVAPPHDLASIDDLTTPPSRDDMASDDMASADDLTTTPPAPSDLAFAAAPDATLPADMATPSDAAVARRAGGCSAAGNDASTALQGLAQMLMMLGGLALARRMRRA